MVDLMNIKDPSFVKKLSRRELKELASEIRKFLIESISQTGGHLSSNLGVVELTIAMYYVFDPEKDKFLFDVGHQAYVHKILTGRASEFKNLRKYNGLSGYINKEESKYDVWESGHSSTSISAMTGMMLADSDKTTRYISIIGDASLMNGVAFEGLNFLGQLKNYAPIIILNDNKMGISKTVGALSKSFNKLRGNKLYRGTKTILNKIFPSFITKTFHQIKRGIKGFIQQDNIFEDMGFDYFGPYDGNDLDYCIKVMKKIKKCKEPVVLHLITEKGKGYAPSEADTNGDFHGVGPFDIKTGKSLSVVDPNMISFSKLVANFLVEKRKNTDFCVVTPAMKSGAKLDEFASIYPNDFYDVGIAEEHAAVLSAGMALSNKNVVLLMYSTFSQRAFDQFLNDITRQNLKVIIGIDRAGIVGEDGATHQGLYETSMFMEMPNIKICMPMDYKETIGLFNYAFNKCDTSIVIRYPRGNTNIMNVDMNYECDLNWQELRVGKKLIVISYSTDVKRILDETSDLDISIINARCIKPIDYNMLKELFERNIDILVIEQNVSVGTLYHQILEFKEKNNYSSKILKHTFSCDDIVRFGSINDVYEAYNFSNNKLREVILGAINEKDKRS